MLRVIQFLTLKWIVIYTPIFHETLQWPNIRKWKCTRSAKIKWARKGSKEVQILSFSSHWLPITIPNHVLVHFHIFASIFTGPHADLNLLQTFYYVMNNIFVDNFLTSKYSFLPAFTPKNLKHTIQARAVIYSFPLAPWYPLWKSPIISSLLPRLLFPLWMPFTKSLRSSVRLWTRHSIHTLDNFGPKNTGNMTWPVAFSADTVTGNNNKMRFLEPMEKGLPLQNHFPPSQPTRRNGKHPLKSDVCCAEEEQNIFLFFFHRESWGTDKENHMWVRGVF